MPLTLYDRNGKPLSFYLLVRVLAYAWELSKPWWCCQFYKVSSSCIMFHLQLLCLFFQWLFFVLF